MDYTGEQPPEARLGETMSDSIILKIDDVPVHARGDGVESTLLVAKERCGAPFTSGITRFPAGKKVPMHSHNCDEQVTILEGSAEVELDGKRTPVSVMDTTYVEAGKPHRFINTGDGPLVIFWVYAAVTRTFIESGETVAHMSEGDVITK